MEQTPWGVNRSGQRRLNTPQNRYLPLGYNLERGGEGLPLNSPWSDVCMTLYYHTKLFSFSLHLHHEQSPEEKNLITSRNTMSCRHHSMVGTMANPPHPSPGCNPEEDICSEADSDAADHSYLPPRCLLYLGMMI